MEEQKVNYEQEVMGLLDDTKFFRIPKNFVKEFGLTLSLYLITLIGWRKHLKLKYSQSENEPFFITQEMITAFSYLSKDQQKLANKKLTEIGVIGIERGGLKNKNNYTINFETLYELITKPIDPYEKMDENGEFYNRETTPPLVDGKSILNTFSGGRTPPLKPDSVGGEPPHSMRETIDRSNSLRLKRVPIGTLMEADASMGSSKKPVLCLRVNQNSPIEFGPVPSPAHRKGVMRIIAYWNASPGLPHHHVPGNGTEAPSKTFVQIAKSIGEVLDGKYLRDWPPYSEEDVIRAIDGFKTRLTNLDYAPRNKSTLKNINLTNFFWNSYTPSEQKSMFLECLHDPPKLLKDTVPKMEEKNPQLTAWIQKLYTDRILLGQPKVFSQVEVNKFIKGSNQLADSIHNLRKRANLITGPKEFCEYIFDALLSQFERDEIKPGNIASEWTYTDLLPRYLTKIGRMN